MRSFVGQKYKNTQKLSSISFSLTHKPRLSKDPHSKHPYAQTLHLLTKIYNKTAIKIKNKFLKGEGEKNVRQAKCIEQSGLGSGVSAHARSLPLKLCTRAIILIKHSSPSTSCQ